MRELAVQLGGDRTLVGIASMKSDWLIPSIDMHSRCLILRWLHIADDHWSNKTAIVTFSDTFNTNLIVARHLKSGLNFCVKSMRPKIFTFNEEQDFIHDSFQLENYWCFEIFTRWKKLMINSELSPVNQPRISFRTNIALMSPIS